jgi:hypothetical protein
MRKSYLILVVTLLMIIPMVAAQHKTSESFDLVYLFVENTFGSILLTALGMIMLMLFIGMISRMNNLTITFLIALFVATFTIGYIGALGAVLFAMFGLWYLWSGVINLINRMVS